MIDDHEDTPEGLPDDIVALGKLLDDIAGSAGALAEAAIRRERPNPMVIDLTASSSTAGVPFGTFQSAVRVRIEWMILNMGDSAGNLQLNVGRSTYTFAALARSLVVVPFPIIIEPGYNVASQNSGGSTVQNGIMLIGYPE